MPLDPVMQQIVAAIPISQSEVLDIPALRAAGDALLEFITGPDGPIAVASVEDLTVAGPRGPIALRIYRPSSPIGGTVHHFYGGGWVQGSIDIIDPIARRMARDLSMVVVTSSYRLAPEEPFPAGFEDCVVAANWTLDQLDQLGGREQPVVLSGESAGANLAAAVALSLRDEKLDKTFDAQLLINPAVDLRESTFERVSMQADADPTLHLHSLRQLYPLYSAGHDRDDPRMSPLAAKDFSSLPPAVIAVLSVDPLRDEGVEYADRLRSANVAVELLEFDDLTHGYSGLSAIVPAADRAFSRTLSALRHLLETLRKTGAPSQ